MTFDPKALGARCHECPLAVNGEPVKPVPATMPVNPVGLLVGETPSRDDARLGRPLVGQTGQALDEVFNSVKLDRKQLGMINAVACQATTRTPANIRQAIKCCAPAFKAQLPKTMPTTPVFAMGPHAVRALGSRVKVGNGRGFVRPATETHGPWIISWSPTHALIRDPKIKGAFLIDLERYARLTKGACNWQLPEVNINPTPQDLDALIAEDAILGCDIETGPAILAPAYTGKDSTRARLKTIAFATEQHAIALLWHGDRRPVERTVAAMLATPNVTKVFHNGFLFDAPVLVRHGAPVNGIEDTRDMRRALSSTSALSLRYLVSLYLDSTPWKEADDEDEEKLYASTNLTKLLQYNAYDALLTRRLYGAMLKELHNG